MRVGAKGTVGENKEPEVVLIFCDLIDCVNESASYQNTVRGEGDAGRMSS